MKRENELSPEAEIAAWEWRQITLTVPPIRRSSPPISSAE